MSSIWIFRVKEVDGELDQMDGTTAFVNGDMDGDVYMEVPEGCRTPGSNDLVCKLLKSVHGTKQAPRCWNQKINPFLGDELGFMPCVADACFYVRGSGDGFMIIAGYVDDFSIAGKIRKAIDWWKAELNKRFEMKDLGLAKVCVGLEISRARHNQNLFLSQKNYIEAILEQFGMNDCNPVDTPMEEPRDYEKRLELHNCDNDPTLKNIPYHEAIGSLMYLMVGSRPDLAYSVEKLAQYRSCPKQKHCTAEKRLFRFFKWH